MQTIYIKINHLFYYFYKFGQKGDYKNRISSLFCPGGGGGNTPPSSRHLLESLGLFFFGIGVWLLPQQLLGPILPELVQFPGSTISIPKTIAMFAKGLAIAVFLWAGLALWWDSAGTAVESKTTIALALFTVVGSYLVLAWTLGSWMIDDAAITFAYSQNLIRGNGLVLHPNLPPEEGYSNTLWMLLVALPLLWGVKVSVTGKVLSLLLGAGIQS